MKNIQLLILTIILPVIVPSQEIEVKSFQEINNEQGGLDSALAVGDRFGTSVEVIGDVDHDGIDDIAVGANFDDDGATDRGAVYILMLNADGTVKSQQKISENNGNGPTFYSGHRFFGSSIAALGDLNGDGNVDIAVGGQNCSDDGVSTSGGAVYILFLDDDGTVLEYNKISDNQGGGDNFLGSNKYFGVSVANIGDLDGDGLPDIAVGAHGDDDGGTNKGCIYVLNLDYNGTAKKIQKISAITGGFMGGLSDNDLFGVSVTAIDDLDGDGVIDIVVAARNDDDGGTNRGAVWVCFMNVDGTVKSEQKISDTAGGFTGTLDDSDLFGTSLVNLGDLDGDGISELGVGAQLDDDGGTNSGALWILFLNADGTVKSYDKIAGDDPIMGSEVKANDRFMCDVACFGDRDNDGKIDLLAGAWNAREVITTGEIYIMHLDGPAIYPNKPYHQSSQFITSVVKYSDVSGEPLYNELDNSDVYGASITGIGDLDGDGINDIIVGADLDDDGGSNKGAIYVQFLNTDGSIKNYQKISSTEGGFTGYALGGRSLTNMGDLDGDGITDVAVGYTRNATNTGLIRILFLDTNGTLKSDIFINEGNNGFTGDLDLNDYFGYAVANIGDLNGDNVKDIAVGAFKDDDGGTDKGAVWILFLDSNGTVKSEQKISDTQGNFSGNLDNGDAFGYSLANVGDMDGDGNDELAVGVQKDDDGGSDAGAVYILYLTDSGTVSSSQKISEPTSGLGIELYNFDYFGKSIVGGYDFDMDGINDLLIGARDFNDGGKDRGAVFMLLMNSDGSIKSHKTISSTSNQLTGLIDNVDYFGSSLAIVDYNTQNNTAKIAVGAYYDDDGATNSGAVYVVEIKTYLDLITDYNVVPVNSDGLGSIELSPKDGTAPYTYFWTDGDYSQNKYELESDTYTVTIVDSLQDSLIVNILVGMKLDWNSVAGLTTDYDKLVKTDTSNSWGTGLASLNNIAGEEGEILIEVEEIGKEWTVGLRLLADSQANQYSDMEYALYINSGNKVYSWENSILTYLTTIVIGDVLSIEKDTTQILFKKNGISLRSVDHNGQDSYYMDFSLLTSLMTVGPIKIKKWSYWPKPKEIIVHNICYIPNSGSINLSVTGAIPPYTYSWIGPNSFTAITQDIIGLEEGDYTVSITSSNAYTTVRTYAIGYQVNWTDIEGATASSNTIQKTAINGYGNSGGASNNSLSASTKGWAEFMINDDNVDELLFGLSDVNTDESIATIDYGFRFYHYGTNSIPVYVITENGVDKTTVAKMYDGNKFLIKRDANNNIKYYVDNVPVYTSGTTSASSLIVDVSMDKINSKILKANVSFGCAGTNNIQYVKLKNRLDGGYYNMYNKELHFQYTEEYEVVDFKYLAYSIYDKNHVLVGGVDPAGNILVNGSEILKNNIGENKFELDVVPLALAINEYYTLEVFNDKKDKKVLKFRVYN